jgi:hypothetical protein
MTTHTTTWPDTTGTPPPGDHPYGVALWLLGRHPQLAELVDRLPGIASTERGKAGLDLDALAAALAEYDAHKVAYREQFGWSDPSDETLDRWNADQPPRSPAADELGMLSGTGIARLRLLATLSSAGTRFSVRQLHGFDAAGERLLGDWLDAVRNG